jgi:hypothetical protein
MTRPLAIAALLAGLVTLPALPAHADTPSDVLLTYEYHSVPLDYGYVVAVVCNASADPGDYEDIPVATEVSCSLGTATARQALPGREAVTTITSAVLGPITLSLSGEAAFINVSTGRVEVVARGPECTTLNP